MAQLPCLNGCKTSQPRTKRPADKCVIRIGTLAQFGHELRRPAADYLRDGIYELRSRQGKVQYRILYFYHGQNVAILAHGLVKKTEVPSVDIERAIERKAKFEKNPEQHTFREEN